MKAKNLNEQTQERQIVRNSGQVDPEDKSDIQHFATSFSSVPSVIFYFSKLTLDIFSSVFMVLNKCSQCATQKNITSCCTETLNSVIHIFADF